MLQGIIPLIDLYPDALVPINQRVNLEMAKILNHYGQYLPLLKKTIKLIIANKNKKNLTDALYLDVMALDMLQANFCLTEGK